MESQPEYLTSKSTGIFICKKDAIDSGMKDALYRGDLSEEDQKMIKDYKKEFYQRVKTNPGFMAYDLERFMNAREVNAASLGTQLQGDESAIYSLGICKAIQDHSELTAELVHEISTYINVDQNSLQEVLAEVLVLKKFAEAISSNSETRILGAARDFSEEEDGPNLKEEK